MMIEPSTQEHPETNQAPTDHSSLADTDLRRAAIRRLKKKRAFRSHVFVYVTINVLFWTGWIVGGLVDRWVFPWPIFPTVFWGLFVLGMARDLYGTDSISEEHIQHEIDLLRHTSRRPDTHPHESR